jgi:hypothetical protein
MIVFAVGISCAEEGDGLPLPVIKAWTRAFPGTVILRSKTKTADDETLIELKLMDRKVPKGYEVVFSADGKLIEEQKHDIAESEALKVLRFFALFGTLDEKAQVSWTAEKDGTDRVGSRCESTSAASRANSKSSCNPMAS